MSPIYNKDLMVEDSRIRFRLALLRHPRNAGNVFVLFLFCLFVCLPTIHSPDVYVTPYRTLPLGDLIFRRPNLPPSHDELGS